LKNTADEDNMMKWRETVGRDHSEDLGIDGKMSEWILGK
jgi:hypothetical protein